MTGLLRFIYFILFFWLIRSLFRMLFGRGASNRGTQQTRSASQPKTTPAVTGHMIKDPNCGTYVASQLAVTANLDGKTIHFCSTECRDQYLSLGPREPAPSLAAPR